ncbi:growth/differentiation factor 8 [Musca vetustissima]|uniref:growth/differentiation factor 8 n=1 Tax=Musca vetustissima TaxID=27455 RepID=UPI002AB69801|nr:growth/differentiation factor 8 [Musca vetustissima]
MAKYFITFVLLALLAMENNNIYNRLHAKSQPSGDTNAVTHFMRQHHQYQHHGQVANNHHPTHDQHHTHHARKHVKQHQRHNIDSNEEEDSARRYAQRYKRHMELQVEHRRQIESRLHHRPVFRENAPKNIPRLWQHLYMVYDDYYESSEERMFGDAPNKNSLEYEEPEMPVYVEDKEEDDNSDSDEDEKPKKSTNIDSSSKSVDIRCPKCENSHKDEDEEEELVSEEELTRLRIEYVKQQILDKLRLKERPHVPAVNLPKPILEGTTIQQEEEDTSTKKDLDDYYARTSKKVIFLDVEQELCGKLGSDPSMCFSFKLDDSDADSYDVSTAVLWLFKTRHPLSSSSISGRNQTSGNPQRIVVSEVQQETTSNRKPSVKTIAVQSIDVQDEWMKIDIEWPIKRWYGKHDLSHLIQITCQSCDMAAMEHIISTDMDYRPFIIVNTQSRRRQTRQKRTINCTHGVTECCREKLYISFEDIGWSDWIIEPKGYDAYFCRGSCNRVASVANSASPHSSFVQKLLNKPGRRNRNLELVPCCTAKTYSSLQLLYLENNSTGTVKTFPNMIVESCGCR